MTGGAKAVERRKNGRPGPTSERVSVIVPTLNEVENIDLLVRSILAQATANLELEVLIADGGSIDGTIERVKAWEAKTPVRLIEAGGGRGLAGDVLTAAELATSTIIVVMDADFSHAPESIPELVAPILAGTSDMVVGSRYVAMPLVIGLMPFAVLTVLSARLLRARPRPPKLSS